MSEERNVVLTILCYKMGEKVGKPIVMMEVKDSHSEMFTKIRGKSGNCGISLLIYCIKHFAE